MAACIEPNLADAIECRAPAAEHDATRLDISTEAIKAYLTAPDSPLCEVDDRDRVRRCRPCDRSPAPLG